MKRHDTILIMEEEVNHKKDQKQPRKRNPPKKCVHNKVQYRCKLCKGKGICEHDKVRSRCKQCGGSEICVHMRLKSSCRDCKGGSICIHSKQRSACKDCNGGALCQHGKVRSRCKNCNGKSFCQHGKLRTRCLQCGGSAFCIHKREKYKCKDCKKVRAEALQKLKTPGLLAEPGLIRKEIDDIVPDLADQPLEEPVEVPGWMDRVEIYDPPADGV